MLFDYITSALATMLVVADPFFMSALFLGITHGMSKAHRREVALRASIIAFFILLLAGLGGAKLLELLGISLSAFRIAGGLLLLSSAAEMVFDRRSERLKATAEQAITVDHVRNIAAFPLAIPLKDSVSEVRIHRTMTDRTRSELRRSSAVGSSTCTAFSTA